MKGVVLGERYHVKDVARKEEHCNCTEIPEHI